MAGDVVVYYKSDGYTMAGDRTQEPNDITIGQGLSAVLAAGYFGDILLIEADQHNIRLATIKRIAPGYLYTHLTIRDTCHRHCRTALLEVVSTFDFGHNLLRPVARRMQLAVDHHLRCIDIGQFQLFQIALLTLGKYLVRKRVHPANIVPVIHVETQRQYTGLFPQFGQQLVSCRARRTTLRPEELDDR